MKKKRNKKRSPMFSLAMFTLCFLALWWVYGLVGSGESSFVAMPSVVEDMISADGVFVRNEMVINSDAKGTLQSTVKEGEKVAKGERIGLLIKGNIDPALQSRLESVNSRIAEVRANVQNPIATTDITAIDDKLSNIAADITMYATQGDQFAINRLRKDIDGLVEKKNLISGQSGPAAGVLDRLLEEKKTIEDQMGQNKSEISSPISGVFSPNCDGYENLLHPDKISEINTSNINSILKAKPNKVQQASPYPICKIVDNGEWILAVDASTKDAEGVNVGDSFKLRFPSDPSVELDSWVASISTPQNGRVAICVRSSQFAQGVYSKRITGVDMIKHRYSGLKIPTSALTSQNGKDGVFVQKSAGLQFREAGVIYKGKEFAIVKEDNKNPNSILLYDEVVTKKR